MLRYCCLVLLLASSHLAFSQTVSVSGTVTDKNEPLIGAAIAQVGSSIGTTTDSNGKFQLQVPVGTTLRVSFIGYTPQDFVIKSSVVLNVILVEDSKQMEELIVVGYGSVKKSNLTGSVASIKSDDFVNTAISSLDQGLQGKVAGLVVSMASGQPGAASSVRIRGNNSINGNNEPLYVIDGVFIVPENKVGAVNGPGLNPLSNINPSDIESIEVLKDASSTAIYGTRGANGVIIVTTKRGKKGNTVVTFNYTKSFQELRRKIPMLNASQLAELGNEAADNANVPRRLIYASPVNLGVGTDWQDQIFKIAPMDNYQISARGGNDGTSYSISANYFNQDGIIKNSNFTKGNIRINLDQKVRSNISIGTSLNLTKSSLRGVVTDSESAIPSSVTSWALLFNPGLPVRDANGKYTFANNTAQPSVGNPLEDIERTKQISSSNRLLGNFYLDWALAKGITFRSSFGTDAVFSGEKSFVPNDIRRGQASNGQAAIANQQGINWLWENTVSYSRKIGIHSISAVAGHTLQAYKNQFIFAATSKFDDNRLGYNAIQAGANKTLLFNGTSSWQLESFLGRVNYSLKDKYLLTLSARVDGSSKFGTSNRYGVFPSAAFAWKLKEEDFLKNSPVISDLKWRMSYGVVGNEGIPAFSSLGLLETTEAYFGENNIAKGSGPFTRQNANLKWETTAQSNIGFDLGLFANRVNIVADVYYKKTSDLLLNAPVPYTSGFDYSFFNVGSLENKGLEIALNTVNTVNKVKWNSSFNLAFNRNKVLNLNSKEGIPADALLGINGWSIINAGVAMGTFYGYKTDGIIQQGEDLNSVPRFIDYAPAYGDRKYVDKNGDGIINESDKFVLGNANPDFSFGMSNTVAYKNFLLSVFIQGVYGNEIVNFNRFGLESFDGNSNNSIEALKRWTPENPSNEYPRANASPRINTLSDHQVENGSYLRVKDITLSYDFARLISGMKVKTSSFRFFVTVKNIFTLTKYTGYDPEVNRFIMNPRSFGADYGSYPSTKIYSTGLNITF